jgi:membrane-bound ClpP family serine protease
MESILAYDWIGLVIVGLGTLFLLGEILVNVRGIFALFGIGLIVLYFYAFLPDPSTFAIMIIIYFVGLLLVLVDGKIINDGTLATLGLAGMILSVSLAAPNLFAGLYAVIGLILGAAGAFLLLRIFPPRNMWNKIALRYRLTDEAGYSSINKDYIELIGKTGVTLTDLRPVGTVRIEQKDYSAISNAQWIKKGTNIQVVEVDGTRILVKDVS